MSIADTLRAGIDYQEHQIRISEHELSDASQRVVATQQKLELQRRELAETLEAIRILEKAYEDKKQVSAKDDAGADANAG